MTATPEIGQKTLVLVTTADTDILTADRALAGLPQEFPQVRAFNPVALESEEARAELLSAVGEAGAVVLRLLGGKRAMTGSFDPLVNLCHERGIPLIACPGHQEWDEDLVTACSVPVAELETVFSYLIRGGIPNFRNLFLFLSDTYLGSSFGHEAPEPVPWEGIYHPDANAEESVDVETFIRNRFLPDRPSVGLLFYRAHWMSGNLQFVDDLIRCLESRELNVLPVYSYSLKHNPEEDGQRSRTLTSFMAAENGTARVHCIINTMGLAMSDLSQDEGTGPTIATGWSVDLLDALDVPIIQGIVSTGTRQEWEENSLGLGPIDTAMNVALPEFDGRIITVPISFKEETAGSNGNALATSRLQRYVAAPDRMDSLARLAAKWAGLRLKSNADKAHCHYHEQLPH